MRSQTQVAALARLVGLPPRDLARLAEAELVRVPPALGDEVDEALLARLRRIRRLRRDLGLDPDAVEVVVRLLDRLDAVEPRRGVTAQVRIVRIVAE